MISSVEAAGPCRQRQVPCLARLSRVNATYRQMTSDSPGCRRVEDDRRTARVRRHLERTMHGMDCEGGKVAAHVHLITGRLYCALSKKPGARCDRARRMPYQEGTLPDKGLTWAGEGSRGSCGGRKSNFIPKANMVGMGRQSLFRFAMRAVPYMPRPPHNPASLPLPHPQTLRRHYGLRARQANGQPGCVPA